MADQMEILEGSRLKFIADPNPWRVSGFSVPSKGDHVKVKEVMQVFFLRGECVSLEGYDPDLFFSIEAFEPIDLDFAYNLIESL